MVTRGKTIFGKIIKNVSPYLTKSGARQVGKSPTNFSSFTT